MSVQFRYPKTVEELLEACTEAVASYGKPEHERVYVTPMNQAMLDLCRRVLALEAAR